MANFEGLSNAVIAGDEAKVKELTQAAVDQGLAPLEIINEGLVAGMNVVGARFKEGDMFVPEVLMAARAMHGGMDVVQPLLADVDVPTKGKVIIGTVKGDLHDIGKNLVAMMLESAGYNVVNLGVDVEPEKFVETAKAEGAQFIAMSALLTTTMLAMKDTVDLAKEAGIDVKCIVGGAPVSQEFSDEIGADGFAPDAASATDLCDSLI